MIYVSILIVFSIILCIYGIYNLHKANQIKIVKIHQQSEIDLLDVKVNAFKNQLQTLRNEQIQKKKQIQQLELKIKAKRKQVEKDFSIEQQLVSNRLEQFKKVTQQAASNYFTNLQKDYEHAEAAHKQHLSKLQAEYNQATADLHIIKETRQAAYEAFLRENEIKENKDNYRLKPSRQDLEDIATLEHIRQSLHKPRILSMLMWQTYWQPLAKKQFPIILQDKTKTGIYKITNIQTDQAYIGQSLNIYKRWCDHCKAGLGIDTPVGNKLYQAMLQNGLQNFTFELLCECSKEELNDKEKYFIELYQADLFGYNGTGGNKS